MQVHTLQAGEVVLLDNGVRITILSVGKDAIQLRITADEMSDVAPLTIPARGASRRADHAVVGLN